MAQQSLLAEHFKDDLIDEDALERGNLVGEGSCGKVYKGKWSGSLCAIKRFKKVKKFEGRSNSGESSEEETLLRIIREFKIWKDLKSPNIVVLYGVSFWKDRKLPCLVMEWMPESVSMVLKQKDPRLSHDMKLSILMQVCTGLRYLHGKNLVHGDLTANNILLNFHTDGVTAKITDFGISAFISELPNMTSYSRGMEKYMPPETRDPSYRPEAKTDCYSFGVLTIYILAGKLVNPRYPVARQNEIVKHLTEFERYEDSMKNFTEEDKKLEPVIKSCIQFCPLDRQDLAKIAKEISDIRNNIKPSRVPAVPPQPVHIHLHKDVIIKGSNITGSNILVNNQSGNKGIESEVSQVSHLIIQNYCIIHFIGTSIN